ncbi:MocR-like pyridoxine biosynthesis transcription factor PdxR [Novosphingobium terrae]|uniref:MocR-like pyridoxine biosynthesis transcription factor PdxR n=1 Tax=Novosphingobium terrae TaxID=2726189 RepID=UPI00197D9DFC|nr:PLP-dependent aminotransferase family protein [Novosphingobium terrae]
MTATVSPLLGIDRSLPIPLTEQICAGLRQAIRQETLVTGARLPSWQDLSAQLGVARGTVRIAYERLIDEGLLVSSGAAGTHVAGRLPRHGTPEHGAEQDPFADLRPAPGFAGADQPGLFQMGIPAQDAFPAKLWARLHRRAADAGAMWLGQQDPRGTEALRREIAAHLAIARGLPCLPGQIFITSSFRGALGLLLRALPLNGSKAWVENPGLPFTRQGLRLGGIEPVGLPVDAEGIDIAGARDEDIALAVVTPGQHAPLGHVLSPARRRALLAWAEAAGSWIIEDDYLSELQLEGRAAPALAGQDRSGRVIHIGSFSKTISPALGIGFVVAPEALVQPLLNVATWLVPPPNYVAQLALAAFLREGHYLRHLRKMKRLYAQRRAATLAALAHHDAAVTPAGLAVHMALPEGISDRRLLRRLQADGLSPTALSQWYEGDAGPNGLVLGITNALPDRVERDIARLRALIEAERQA